MPNMMENVSLIDNLNDDCLIQIFSLLPFKDKIRIQRVCKRWRDISRISWNRNETLSLQENDWGVLPYKPLDLSVLENILKHSGNFVTSVNYGYIDTNYLFPVNKKLFTIISEQCPNITAIEVEGCDKGFNNKLSNNCIEYLAELHTNLTEFRVALCREENLDQSLSLLFKRNTNLQYVGLRLSDVSANCWLSLNPEAIREVDVVGVQQPLSAFCTALKSFTNLENFRIAEWGIVVRYDPGNYPHTLDISDVLKAIEIHAESLKYLELYACDGLHFKSIISFTNLEKLCLITQDVEDEFLQGVCKHCINLTYVKLIDIPCVTDVGIKSIAGLPKLQILHLARMEQVSDAIFKCLLSIKQLYCNNCPALETAAVCEFLRTSESLESLKLNSWDNVCINNLINVANEVTKNRLHGRIARYILSTEIRHDYRNYLNSVESKFYKLRLCIWKDIVSM